MQMSMRLRNVNRAPPKKISAGDKNSVIKNALFVVTSRNGTIKERDKS